MFESLADLFGFDSEEREALHLFTARAMDKSPGDPLIFNEVDIGRQLEGDDDVTLDSFKRRTVRVVERIAARAARHGKTVIERIPGKWSMGAGKDSATGKKVAAREEKKVGARYLFHWTQAVAEGADIARRLRAGNRRGKFRRAAEVVFDSEMFPACAPPKPEQTTPALRDASEVAPGITPEETFERMTGGRAKLTVVPKAEERVSPQRVPRTVRRVKDNVALALRAARERDEKKGGGSAEFNRQAAWIVVEVVRTIEREQGGEDLAPGEAIRQAIELLQAVESDPAELSCIEASITALDANTKQDSAGASDLTPASSEPISQNSGQKGENAYRIQDRPVQKNRPSRLIPKEFIDRVRDAADIREVIAAEGVELKRKGRNWTACCPQHGEKTPSFHVTPAKGQFYCFGCQWGGDVFKFIQDTRGVSFREAVETVAASCGMSPPESEPERPPVARAPRELTVEREPAPPEDFEVYDL